MPSNLAVLLSLRRSAEEEAQKALGEAMARRLRAGEEQQRLDFAVEQARHALEQERRRRATGPAPVVVADGLHRERYRQRLAANLAGAARKAAQHRQGPLCQSQAAEDAASARLSKAKQARQTVEKLQARREADQHKHTERRAEDAAGDWVHASHGRGKPHA
jgi:flagellar biosynthesis chaperone FliJ